MNIATFGAISNGALKTKELPKQIKVMDFGKSVTLDDPVFVTDKTLSVFASTQTSIGRDRVPIDFNHNSVSGSMAYSADKEPRAIAGYGTPEVTKDGIYLKDIQWTPTGEKAARDYEDLSPAPILDEQNVVVGMHSVALTPAGAIENLKFYSADFIFNNNNRNNMPTKFSETVAEGGENKAETPETISTNESREVGIQAGEKTKTMSAVEPNAYVTEPQDNKTFKKYMHEQLKTLAAEMNIPDEAELEKKLRALLAKWLGVDGTEVPEGPIINKANSTPAQFSSEVQALTDRLSVLESDRKENIARYEAQEKQNIVSQAAKDGKVVPFSADEIKEIPVKILKTVVDKLTKDIVPTKLTTRVLSSDGKPTEKQTMAHAANAWQEAVTSNGR